MQGRQHQRGLGLISLLFIGGVLVAVGLVGLQVFPTALEYVAIKRAVDKAAREGDNAQAIAASFDRAAAIDDITSITGKDLLIEKDNQGMKVSFAYDKRIALAGPATLLLEYKGTAKR
jgi:Domain of unknown function (DUF4845)